MRKSKLFAILLVSIILCFGMDSFGMKYPKSIQKRINKALKSSFGTDQLSMEEVNIDDINLDAYVGFTKVRLESIKNNDEIIGFSTFASSKGKNDLFDYMVLFDNEMKIQQVVILIYRSSYGGEIMARYWLKQFIGKSNGENMEFEKDIDSISGATISAPEITKGIKSLSLLMTDLRLKDKL